MGAESWSYFVPYQENVEAAMRQLQQVEFEAGRHFNPREYRPELPKPKSIKELLEQCGAQGSRSILDIVGFSEDPDEDPYGMGYPFLTMTPLRHEELLRIYGTDKPTREMVEQNQDFYEGIARGQGVYIIIYDKEKPSQFFFGGYSLD